MTLLTAEEQLQSIQHFVEILNFPTVSNTAAADGSYKACANWLLQQLNDMSLGGIILPESIETKPIVIGVWEGSNPELPAILLNSHYDVVPVLEESWTVPAFEGFRKDGKIYGRGTQDMKCVCVQYLTAVRKLKSMGYQPTRTIYITYVPDEEIGGIDGMNVLTSSTWFESKNFALALDEGLASTDGSVSVFYGERLPWWVRVKATGNTGHGSRFIDGTAVEQVVGIVNKALAFREQQKDILHGRGRHAGCSHAVLKKKQPTLGDVTSLNVTMLRAGVQAGGKDVINVVPSVAEAGFDVRISPHMNPDDFAATLDTWCQEVQSTTTGLPAGGGIKWEFFHDPLRCHAVTSTDPAENPWWTVLQSTLKEKFQIDSNAEVFPAATDSRFLRALGVKVFGFSPIRNSPILLHEHDEYIDETVFLEGCEIYVELIKVLSTQSTF
jgi:aminoacylase